VITPLKVFVPLMTQVEARPGRRPRFGTWDAAYDTHYVYTQYLSNKLFAPTPARPRWGRETGLSPSGGSWGVYRALFARYCVYTYVHQAGGFAAVPRIDNPRQPFRRFAADGAPVCAADPAMALEFRYTHRSDLTPQQKERFRCPLLHPTPTGAARPVADAHFANGGCKTDITAGPGSRIRWQLDRDSNAYKHSTLNAPWSNGSTVRPKRSA